MSKYKKAPGFSLPGTIFYLLRLVGVCGRGGERDRRPQILVREPELIFPLLELMRMRGVVFFDIGNNLNELDSLADLFTRQARYGTGVGVRFNSPLGAIRLDWGFNLNQRPGEKLQVLHFTAGATF